MLSFDQWVATILAAATVAGVIIGWRQLRRSRAQHALTPNAAGGGQAVAGHSNLVVNTLNIQAPPPPTPAAPTREAAAAPPRKPRAERACGVGPHEIPAGDYIKLDLDVEDGDSIEGKLDGDDSFNYYVVSERDYVKLRNGKRFSTPISGEDKPAYSVNWEVEGAGPWLLILDAKHKRYDRTVHVYLRRNE